MNGVFPLRALSAVILVGGGAMAALLLSAPLTAVLLALCAGAAAALISAPSFQTPPASVRTPDPAPKRPSVRDFIEAFTEPVLIVRASRVALMNAAARDLLGESALGEDVRLAIRHPAATARLVDASMDIDDDNPIEIVGLGEPDRRWTMTIARLRDGARLVRLADRSNSHATEQMRTDFVANASHELRTPLATLIGFIETLEDLIDAPAELSERQTRKRFLGIMHGEAKRMQRLVDDLISLSRIEAERFSVPREAHDLLTLVEQARDEQRHLAAERGSRIVIDADDPLPAVAGDRPQLLQLVDNLVANALKYGRPGTDVTVTIRPADDGMLLLSIADQGEGIPREHLPRITERFYRVDPSRSRAAGGTGLGLAIVKHVVERHRGRLDFSSEVGVGTIVTVALPAEPVPQKAMSSKSHGIVTQPAPKRRSEALSQT